jgi:hypothetical protein
MQGRVRLEVEAGARTENMSMHLCWYQHVLVTLADERLGLRRRPAQPTRHLGCGVRVKVTVKVRTRVFGSGSGSGLGLES